MAMRGASLALLLTLLSAALSAATALQLTGKGLAAAARRCCTLQRTLPHLLRLRCPTGRLIILSTSPGDQFDVTYSLFTSAGKSYRLLDPKGALEGLQTGSDVQVTISGRSKNVPGALVVGSVFSPALASLAPQADAGTPPSQRYARTPRVVTQLRALYYVLDICGVGGGPAASVQVRQGAVGCWHHVTSATAGWRTQHGGTDRTSTLVH